MTPEPSPGPLTDADRDVIARARKFAFAGTQIPTLRTITGARDDTGPEMVREEALVAAQALLLDLTVIIDRLDRPETGIAS